MNITCKNITFRYDKLPALDDISLSIKKGELIALLGPSGCGKTTLLRLLAGLLTMQEGSIHYNEKDITHSTPQKRNTVMVFQSYALFPHMTVYDNIAYGLKAGDKKHVNIPDQVSNYIKRVHLEGLENRMIQELSGGQQQRVALARALVLEPDVLLFDEPLSNLDEKLRVKMRREIKELQNESGITTVYVTHDQKEAMAIADRIVVMKAGKIEQIGSPSQVYKNPKTDFVANFTGISNMIITHGKRSLYRPEHIIITQKGQYKGQVKWLEYLGSIEKLGIDSSLGSIIAERFSKDMTSYTLAVGDTVYFDLHNETE